MPRSCALAQLSRYWPRGLLVADTAAADHALVPGRASLVSRGVVALPGAALGFEDGRPARARSGRPAVRLVGERPAAAPTASRGTIQ